VDDVYDARLQLRDDGGVAHSDPELAHGSGESDSVDYLPFVDNLVRRAETQLKACGDLAQAPHERHTRARTRDAPPARC
jgi:hypothetical protein